MQKSTASPRLSRGRAKIKITIKSESAFSTLEMMMAMTILILVLSAVVLVSFSNQSMIIDSQTNAEALNIAQGLLEKAQADSRKDFNLVNLVAQATTTDGFIYRVDVTQGSEDYFTKLVTAYVNFPEDSGRRGITKLSAVVTNFNNAVGGDTCSSVLLPNAETWKNPMVQNKFSDFSLLTGITDNYPITDIDAYKGKLYVTVNNSGAVASTTPTFFVFDISSPNIISAISGDFVDNDLTKQSGLNAVTVAEDVATKKIYAYVASASSITTGQLQVIDVSSVPPVVVKSLPVSGKVAGNSIFFKNGFVYLGLKASTMGPEFHIIDVHNIGSGIVSEVGHWPASGSLNHDINSIYVRGRYAYLATPASKNLIVLDISNASAPVEVGSFDDGGGNHGKSIFLAGNVLYLGRTTIGAGGGTELSILDESNPATTTPSVFYSESSINKSVDGVIVRGKLNIQIPQSPPALAFLLTPSNFMVFNVSDSKNIGQWGTEPLEADTFGSSTFEPVLDCEGNNFFVGSNSSLNNGYISLITP